MKNPKPKAVWLLFTTVFAVGSLLGTTALAADVGLMTKDELKAALNDQDLVILDARAGKDWKSSEFKIQGAMRAGPGEFDEWGGKFGKDKKIVLYCA